MTPTEILRNEHTLILRALDLLVIAADRLERGAVVPDASWSELLAWLGVFADQNHHAKEECGLFPAMIEAGAPPLPAVDSFAGAPFVRSPAGSGLPPT